MPRIKRGTFHIKKRRQLLKQAKGFKWGRKKTIKLAKTAVKKAGVNKYRSRRLLKRDMRSLWTIRLNAAVREHGLSYSKFINALKKKNIILDRKVLAQLATEQPQIFTKIVEAVK